MRAMFCPWCRSPKIGMYPDLWYYENESCECLPLTEDIVRHGFLSNFNYDNYVERFKQTMLTAVINLTTMVGTGLSFKMLLHVIADCVNSRTNFPIFVYYDKRNMQYCSKRWRLIEEHICRKLTSDASQAGGLINELRPALVKLLFKMKELAPEGNLQIVML